MEVVEFRPERQQYAFTFGGVAPVRKVKPGTVLRLWTEDAFCGTANEPLELTLWVMNDRFATAARCPLLPPNVLQNSTWLWG